MSQLRLNFDPRIRPKRLTRGVFSRGYLLRHLRRESDHFVSAADAEDTYNFAGELWGKNRVAMRKRSEAFTCSKFIELRLGRASRCSPWRSQAANHKALINNEN